MEATNAVRQATCDNCDEETAELRVIARDHDMTPEDDEDVHITRTVRCSNCKSTGTVSVGYDGTSATGCVSFEDASWNSDSDESDE